MTHDDCGEPADCAGTPAGRWPWTSWHRASRSTEASVRRLFTAPLPSSPVTATKPRRSPREAFVRVFERWDRVRDFDDSTGYLFRVSMNLFRGRFRRASLAVRRTLFLEPKPNDDLADVDTHDAAASAFSVGLDPKQRAGRGALRRSWTTGCGGGPARCSASARPRSVHMTRAPAEMKRKAVEPARAVTRSTCWSGSRLLFRRSAALVRAVCAATRPSAPAPAHRCRRRRIGGLMRWSRSG